MGTKIRDKFVEHMEFSGLAKQTQRRYVTVYFLKLYQSYRF